jgi:ATP-dependent RNA helicase DOB1
MNTDDLFSFLDETTAEGSNALMGDSIHANPVLAQKRKPQPPAHDGDFQMHDLNDNTGPPVSKKPRIMSPKPQVLDEFETEAKREVLASGGLSANVDTGTRLELTHQV